MISLTAVTTLIDPLFKKTALLNPEYNQNVKLSLLLELTKFELSWQHNSPTKIFPSKFSWQSVILIHYRLQNPRHNKLNIKNHMNIKFELIGKATKYINQNNKRHQQDFINKPPFPPTKPQHAKTHRRNYKTT